MHPFSIRFNMRFNTELNMPLRVAIGALVGLVAISSANAQLPASSARAMTGHESADSAQSLVNFITMVNRDEIALGQLALKKASRADVKAYAQKVVDDHTNAMTAWAQKVPAQSLTIPEVSETIAKPPRAGSDAMANGISEVRDTITRAKGGVGPAAMHSTNLSSLADLEKLDGAAFDAKYLELQLDAHDTVLMELAKRPITYTDLQTLLTTFRRTIEDHELAAKKLAGMR